MNTNGLFLLPLYLLSLFMFFNCSNMYLIWVLMEINMICFILMMFKFASLTGKRDTMNLCLFYFMVQSIGSFIFLLFILMSFLNFLVSDIFFILSLSFKLGLFPFYFWFISISLNVEFFIFILLISLQKFPLLYLMFSNSSYFLFMVLITNNIFGSFMMFNSETLVELMVFSSIYCIYWIYFLFELNISMFFIFFFLYTFSGFQMGMKINSNFSFSFFSMNIFSFMLFSLFFLGLPPMSLFFFKVLLTSFILMNWSIMYLVLFSLLSFFSLFGYIKLLYKYFFFNFSHYLNNELFFMKMSFFNFTLSFFTIFLIFQGKLYLSCRVHTSFKGFLPDKSNFFKHLQC